MHQVLQSNGFHLGIVLISSANVWIHVYEWHQFDCFANQATVDLVRFDRKVNEALLVYSWTCTNDVEDVDQWCFEEWFHQLDCHLDPGIREWLDCKIVELWWYAYDCGIGLGCEDLLGVGMVPKLDL